MLFGRRSLAAYVHVLTVTSSMLATSSFFTTSNLWHVLYVCRFLTDCLFRSTSSCRGQLFFMQLHFITKLSFVNVTIRRLNISKEMGCVRRYREFTSWQLHDWIAPESSFFPFFLSISVMWKHLRSDLERRRHASKKLPPECPGEYGDVSVLSRPRVRRNGIIQAHLPSSRHESRTWFPQRYKQRSPSDEWTQMDRTDNIHPQSPINAPHEQLLLKQPSDLSMWKRQLEWEKNGQHGRNVAQHSERTFPWENQMGESQSTIHATFRIRIASERLRNFYPFALVRFSRCRVFVCFLFNVSVFSVWYVKLIWISPSEILCILFLTFVCHSYSFAVMHTKF